MLHRMQGNLWLAYGNARKNIENNVIMIRQWTAGVSYCMYSRFFEISSTRINYNIWITGLLTLSGHVNDSEPISVTRINNMNPVLLLFVKLFYSNNLCR